MAVRQTRDVIEDHIALRRDTRLEDDLARNYHPDVVLLSAEGVHRWATRSVLVVTGVGRSRAEARPLGALPWICTTE